MTTFAHTESGKALQPLSNDTADDYLARFSLETTEGWQVVEVPDGTEHGATPDGHGGWSNPVSAPSNPAPQPLALTKDQFLVLYAQNSGDLTATLANWP